MAGIDSAGFPDGYISPYDRLTFMPQIALSTILLFSGMVVLVRVVCSHIGRLDVILCLAMLLCIYIPMCVIESCPRVQICTLAFESATGVIMDDRIMKGV